MLSLIFILMEELQSFVTYRIDELPCQFANKNKIFKSLNYKYY